MNQAGWYIPAIPTVMGCPWLLLVLIRDITKGNKMSVARTARRRRAQAKLGYRGLEQVFGKKAAPHYPGVMSKEKSAKKGEKLRAARARGAKM